MAGGGNYVLDKGYPVLATYNSSAAAGVTRFRAVKWAVASSVQFIDLNVAATVYTIGVVQEDIDAVKVATGKAVANVALLGITKMFVTTGTSIVLGSPIAATASGGAILAATGGTNFVIGTCVGMTVPGGTVGAGDLIDVLLNPTGLKLP
jgi:hypothetical protein